MGKNIPQLNTNLPNKHLTRFPSTEALTTIKGIRQAYGSLINDLRKKKLPREDATALGFLLNSFIRGLREILEMKIALEDTQNNPIITDVKMEELKRLVDKMDNLHKKFKEANIPYPSGEINKSPQKEQ